MYAFGIKNLEDPMTDVPTEIFRILDAAANRTREGLRVIEDFVRFELNDGHFSQILKDHRHKLASIISELPASFLLTARDTSGDVGTTISTPAEYVRRSSTDVVTAAFKRVQEALRTLEEYSKVVDPKISPQFEQLRYQLYTTEKVVLRTNSARKQFEEIQLYLLVTATECNNGFETVVKEALDAGVKIIQSREKSLTDREWVSRARILRHWTAAAGALLIINDRPDIALVVQADGVHLGQDEFSVQDARSVVGPDKLIGVSTHSIEQARQAVLDGADYLGVGPTFPTSTKSFAQFPGLRFIQEVAVEIQLPWFAIGGINGNNISDVTNAGADRIAVSSAICHSPTPSETTRQMLTMLSSLG
jgi:thiamine-phosphate pyrophosphorylase